MSYFGSAGLFCYDLSGKELWKFEMPMAVTAADFGTGASPILADGNVVLVRDEMKDPKIVVIDAATGSLKWEKKRQSPTSYCTPIVWDKQIVSAGYGRMIAYDAKTGDEVWSVAGMPAACCTSPIVVDDTLFFAGWSPGDAEDKEFKMPTFDKFLESDTNKDGKVSREESENSFLKGFFDNNDTDKDGFITRAEWDATLKYISAGKNSAMAISLAAKAISRKRTSSGRRPKACRTFRPASSSAANSCSSKMVAL